jgi:hypothetical protein
MRWQAEIGGLGLRSQRHVGRLSLVGALATFHPVFLAGLKLPPLIWWNNLHRTMAAVDDLGCRKLLG